MTDKEKIKAEVSTLIGEALLEHAQYATSPNILYDLKKEYSEKIVALVDSMQEEPVSVWHNMNEIPIKGEVIVVQTKNTFYGLSVQKGGTTYKNKNKDRYVRWAYASDLLNLSNVQRTTKNWKEPISIDFEQELYKAFGQVKDFTLGMRIAKWFYDMGKNSHKPVSEDLEKAANEWNAKALDTPFYMALNDNGNPYEVRQDYTTHAESFKVGAEWQIAKLMANATDVEVKVDAGGYPYIPQIELYDYDNDVPLAKAGDKYKVMLIKED